MLCWRTLRDHIQHAAQRGTGRQSPFRGKLDGRPVGHRVGEGDPELDQVDAAFNERVDDLLAGRQVRVTGRDKGNESFFVAFFERSSMWQ